MVVRPEIKYAAGEFATVIHEDPYWSSTLGCESIAHIDYVLCAQSLTDSDVERLTSKRVNNGQRSERRTLMTHRKVRLRVLIDEWCVEGR